MPGAALTFHHVGLATKSLDRARAMFEALGYHVSEPEYVPSQRVRVSFVTRDGQPTVELIEPVDPQSPVQTVLDKVGSTVYHLCFSTCDFARAVQDLRRQHFMPVGDVFVSHPLSDQQTCFFYNASVGLIELTAETQT
jgi:methylmalonyl-CoA/ethylmalonyl-CoA epimerase